MNSIRQAFDQVLSDHLERLLGTQSGTAVKPFTLLNISIAILLADQAANVRDQMISEDDCFTRKALLAELVDVALCSESEFNQAIDELLNGGSIQQAESGKLMAGEALVKMARLLDSALPNMPGLNLIAYVSQTLDEAESGRKSLEDAVSQFDQTLTMHGNPLSGTQKPPPKKELPKHTREKKSAKISISDEESQRLIKSIHQEVENKPARQSKVISAKNQNEIKTVAFGQVKKVPETDTQNIQDEELGPELAQEVLDPEPEKTDDNITEIETPYVLPAKEDPDSAAVELESPGRQHFESSLAENDLDDADISADMSTELENRSHHPEHDPSETSKPDVLSSSASTTTSEDLIAPPVSIQDEESTPDLSETTDDIVAKQINEFESDLAMQCPLCKSTTIVSEVTTKGKAYYKCPNKICNFISWGKPFHNECPRCHNPFLIEAQKNGATILKCPRATCNYWQGGPGTSGLSSRKPTAHMRSPKSGPPKRRRKVVKRRVVRRKK